MQKRLRDENLGEEQTPTLNGSLNELASDLTQMLTDHRQGLPPNLGMPGLLLFVLLSIMRETMTREAPFR